MGLVWVPDIAGRLTHSLEFFVDQPPRGWKRAIPFRKGNYVGFRDPEENINYKAYVRHKFMSMCARERIDIGTFPWPGPVRLTTHALFRPARTVKMWVGKEHQQDPDASNIAKLVEDALFMPNAYRRKNPKIPPQDRDVVWVINDDNQNSQVISTKQWYERNGTIVKLELFELVEAPPASTRPRLFVEEDRYGYSLPPKDRRH